MGGTVQTHLTYRRDIDGLRAIAVGAVVLYHFGVPGLPGGFTGVDVFFVLSGFLIGGILWREQEATGRIALGDFYIRRIRRLAPAYVAMALATALVSWFVLLPFEFREFGKQLIAATIYLSNVFFWREAGYFDSASDEKPLLHSWSLSVEEQFYIIVPLLLILLYRLSPRLRIPLLWLGFAASLVACIQMTPKDSVSAFYLIHFRAWELLAGVLLAVHMAQGWAPRWGGWASSGGLILIALALVTTQAGPAFPGWQAVVPVAGTVLMLIGGVRANPVSRVLSWRGPVALGLISYSLYLWHWPVFVLSNYVRDGYSGALEIAGWIALSVVLATLSWRFVEQPFRRNGPSPRAMLGLTALASVALLGFGGWLFRSDGMPQRFAPEVRPHIAASADFLQDFSRCTRPDTGPLQGVEICPIGPEGTADLLVWGDSHLRALHAGIDRAAWEAGRPGLLIWHAGCPPLVGITKRESYATPDQDAACSAANARIDAALPEMALRDVLLVGRWSYYATGTGVGRDAGNTIALSPAFADALPTTIEALTASGARIHVLRQVPEVPRYDSREMARALAHGRLSPEQANVQSNVSESAAQARAAAADSALRAHADAGEIRLIDPWPRLCHDGTCRALPGGAPYYFDNNHITNQGALALRDLFSPLMTRGPGT